MSEDFYEDERPKKNMRIEDDDDFDPINEPKIERSYTKGSGSSNASGMDIPEPEFAMDDNDDFSDFTNAGAGQDYSQVNAPKPNPEKTKRQPREPKNEELKDLDPVQKRKAARKTAEAIMDTYCTVVPAGMSHLAKFSTSKLNKLARENKVDPFIPFGHGMNFSQFVALTNKEVDNAFTIDEEERKGIQEPLEEVLLEQGLALTATQRLLIAVGSSLGKKLMAAFAIMKSNREAIEVAIQLTQYRNNAESSGTMNYGFNPFNDEMASHFGSAATNTVPPQQHQQGGSGTMSDAKVVSESYEKMGAKVEIEKDDAPSAESFLKMTEMEDDPTIEIAEEI